MYPKLSCKLLLPKEIGRCSENCPKDEPNASVESDGRLGKRF